MSRKEWGTGLNDIEGKSEYLVSPTVKDHLEDRDQDLLTVSPVPVIMLGTL